MRKRFSQGRAAINASHSVLNPMRQTNNKARGILDNMDEVCLGEKEKKFRTLIFRVISLLEKQNQDNVDFRLLKKMTG